MKTRYILYASITLSLAIFSGACSDTGDDGASVTCQTISEGYGPAGTVNVDVERIASGLQIPWGIDWLPDGTMLLTERAGTLSRILPSGAIQILAELPLDVATMEGGLLGLAIHPDVATNGWFYLYYTTIRNGRVANVVERWVLASDRTSATADRIIVDDIPALQFHNGGRLRFGPDGHLYIGTGDAGIPESSQDIASLGGKILRVTDEGKTPDDNPFPGSLTWIYGVRNTQGFDWLPDGRMVMTDHGPSGLPYEDGRTGHDEINVVRPGDNLGWPDDYACEERPNRVVPSMTWVDPLPPGGTAVYTGTEISEWTGDVFIGVLGVGGAIGHLHRVRLADDGNVTLHETYFLGDGFGRIRDVVMGPDGLLYFTTSRCDGRAECGDGDAIFRVVSGTP